MYKVNGHICTKISCININKCPLKFYDFKTGKYALLPVFIFQCSCTKMFFFDKSAAKIEDTISDNARSSYYTFIHSVHCIKIFDDIDELLRNAVNFALIRYHLAIIYVA